MAAPVTLPAAPKAALDAALAAIDAAFGEHRIIADRKRMARVMLQAAAGLRRWEGRYAFWGRYRQLARPVCDALTLDEAVAALETEFVLARSRLKRSAGNWWADKGLPRRVDHMREARMMLRWCRRYDQRAFVGIIERLQGRFDEWEAAVAVSQEAAE